jgi:hypothetical protein
MTRLTRTFALVAALGCFLAVPAWADDLSAEQIISKSQESRRITNSVQTLTMELFDKSGRSRSRTITSKIKQVEGKGVMSYVRFDQPEDVAGVQFLTRENPNGEDDQFLYMPAGDILNRISGSSRRGSFMGTDFSFEDLNIGSPDDGTHTSKAGETITIAGKSFDVYVIETVPKPELESAYSRLVTYIDKADFMPRQVLFFDKKDENIKRMTVEETKKDGDSTVPVRTVMENLKRGSKTVITVGDYRTNVPAEELPDSMFTEAYLRSEG